MAAEETMRCYPQSWDVVDGLASELPSMHDGGTLASGHGLPSRILVIYTLAELALVPIGYWNEKGASHQIWVVYARNAWPSWMQPIRRWGGSRFAGGWSGSADFSGNSIIQGYDENVRGSLLEGS